MTLLFALLARASAADIPTCFPMTAAVRAWTQRSDLRVPVFVEEHTACRPDRPAPVAPAVPPALGVHEALAFIVERSVHDREYTVTARAGGWLIAPRAGAEVLDLRVTVDRAAATVTAAERQMFDQLVAQRLVWIGHRPYDDVRDTLPNGVTLAGQPLLEALRAVYQPHEAAPLGFAVTVEPGTRPGRRVAHFELLYSDVDPERGDFRAPHPD